MHLKQKWNLPNLMRESNTFLRFHFESLKLQPFQNHFHNWDKWGQLTIFSYKMPVGSCLSCVRMPSCPCTIRIYWNILEYILKYTWIHWNILEYTGIYWNILEYILEYTRIYWNTLEYTGIYWNTLECTGRHIKCQLLAACVCGCHPVLVPAIYTGMYW